MPAFDIKQLIKDLQSDDEETRRYAAEDMGDTREPEVIPFLVKALFDPSVAVQEAAVDSLIAIGGEKVCESVIPLLDNDDAAVRNLAREVFEGVGVIAIDFAVKLYDSKSHDLRKIAIDTLGKIEETKYCNALETVFKALDDEHINVVQAACEALGKLNCEEAVEQLVNHLGIHPWVDATIFLSLGRIGTFEAKEALEKINPENLSQEAAYALKIALEMV